MGLTNEDRTWIQNNKYGMQILIALTIIAGIVIGALFETIWKGWGVKTAILSMMIIMGQVIVIMYAVALLYIIWIIYDVSKRKPATQLS